MWTTLENQAATAFVAARRDESVTLHVIVALVFIAATAMPPDRRLPMPFKQL